MIRLTRRVTISSAPPRTKQSDIYMTTSPFKFEIGEKVKYEDLGLGDALSVTPSRFFYEYYFLFVAHGATLTSHNMSMDLPLFDKEFSDMNFFSQNEKITTISTPDGTISPNFISRVINTPTYIINRGTRSTEWKVPPMFFSALKNDKKDILLRNFMGLWFIDYKTAQIDRLIDLPNYWRFQKRIVTELRIQSLTNS